MLEKSTSDLEKELLHTDPFKIEQYFSRNEKEFVNNERQFMHYMNQIIEAKGLLKQDILLKADIPQGYGYKLLNEEKHTRQRDTIIRICYAAEMSIDETQHALKLYHMDTLYARVVRDALIMSCFNNRPGSIIEVNELLMKNKMAPLRSSGSQD